MLQIRCSTSPFQEVELEGSRSELAGLQATFLDFFQSDFTTIEVATDQDFDPSPYALKLSGLRVTKADGMLVFEREGDFLSIKGRIESLSLFADNLPFDADVSPYHVHFDRNGREGHVSANSWDIVLSLRG